MSVHCRKIFPLLLLVFLYSELPGRPGAGRRLLLDPGDSESFAGPGRLALAGEPGEETIFLLDRGQALLYRVSPATGEVIWRIDGSESGEPFIDPAYLSRPDGFFIYLTDRGSRRVWRIDYRGELRGKLDLSFAVDPILLELAAGNQMVLYDRATSLVHLLDDSGRPLWSFPTGGGSQTAEPSDIGLSGDGSMLYLLWSEPPAITAVDIFGRGTSEIRLSRDGFSPLVLALVAGDEGGEMLYLAPRQGSIVRLDPRSGSTKRLPGTFENLWDMRALSGAPGLLYLLCGGETALVVQIDLEAGGE